MAGISCSNTTRDIEGFLGMAMRSAAPACVSSLYLSPYSCRFPSRCGTLLLLSDADGFQLTSTDLDPMRGREGVAGGLYKGLTLTLLKGPLQSAVRDEMRQGDGTGREGMVWDGRGWYGTGGDGMGREGMR